jgi:hypothetical protein
MPQEGSLPHNALAQKRVALAPDLEDHPDDVVRAARRYGVRGPLACDPQAWRTQAPWALDEQVEQDLVLPRALSGMFARHQRPVWIRVELPSVFAPVAACLSS